LDVLFEWGAGARRLAAAAGPWLQPADAAGPLLQPAD
jgi:hypothetical protein